MKVEVDQVKCGTIGICVKLCPQVFRFHPGNKKAYVIVNPIPCEFEEKCIEAAEKCPNKAITVMC